MANTNISVYNKWHETELERWLSDNNIPYPTPSDRKDLENLVKDNWQSRVATPYNDWDTEQLTSYLKLKGLETKDTAAQNKDSLLATVKSNWYEAEDKAEDAWSSVKDWIFDSWTGKEIVLLVTDDILTLIRLSDQGVCRQARYSRPSTKETRYGFASDSLKPRIRSKEGR